MQFEPSHKGIWFVYDGACPLCKSAATALRIKGEYGHLELIDARKQEDHPLLVDIKERQFDLDEGMVIFDGRKFYHGATALWFMAQYGDADGMFNRVTRLLFRSRTIANLLYPLLRGVRNMLLRIRGVAKLNNLS